MRTQYIKKAENKTIPILVTLTMYSGSDAKRWSFTLKPNLTLLRLLRRE